MDFVKTYKIISRLSCYNQEHGWIKEFFFGMSTDLKKMVPVPGMLFLDILFEDFELDYQAIVFQQHKMSTLVLVELMIQMKCK